MASQAPAAVSSSKPSNVPSRARPRPGHPVRRAVIDHQSYPHLIDLILELGDHGTVLAMRSTSKKCKSRIDVQLSRHMVLAPSDPPFRSVLGTHPALAGDCSPSGTLWPWPTAVSAEMDAIDLLSSSRFPAAPRGILRPVDLKTVRLWSESPQLDETALDPGVLVLFSWPSSATPGRQPSYPRQTFTASASKLRKAVLNLAVADTKLSKPLCIVPLLSSSPHLERLVVIFEHARGRALGKTLGTPSVLLQLLNEVARFPRVGRPLKITFVNDGILAPGVFDDEDALRTMGIPAGVLPQTATLADVTQWFLRCHVRAPPGAASPCECLSLEEYEAEVGSDQYRLETAESYRLVQDVLG